MPGSFPDRFGEIQFRWAESTSIVARTSYDCKSLAVRAAAAARLFPSLRAN